ncbi:hydrogenase [Trebonia kvetii]|uniref:Hydrogenase n=1 Tax=Trebonia kvetii TaxID=2480626 RepID=A0A6P2BPX8_9ACTN|nr:proton-conducting transporter membrane subunit [Trebonia kvetii]TVZ01159.1 hydrogenase [Trebonia kvetii]
MKTQALLLVPVVVPLLGAACFLLATLRPGRCWPLAAWVSPACAAVSLGAAIALAVVRSGHEPATALGGLLRADPLSEFMLIVIGAVGLLATAASPAWLNAEIAARRASPRAAARHSALVQLFLAAMATAVLAASLSLTWVAIEGTTIVTAFLVGQRKTRQAVEAAWKYVMICSTGIALALLGLLVLNAAAAHAGLPAGLDWTRLVAAAPHLDRGVTRIAVALLVIGFGTKAGLAPLHAWLPDAHGQAPAPVSALMSGVLLSVAMYAILRVKAIADLALGTGYPRTLLIILALASLLVAASLLIRQRDYKRMLAYSSIEHMGLLAIGAAAGSPLAVAAVLLHMLGHGLAKGSLFISAGRVLQLTGTHRIDQVHGLASRAPLLAGCLGTGVLALLGFPPFSLFTSELGIARAGFASGLGWVTALALALVLVIASMLLTHVSPMLLGPAPAATDGELAAGAAPPPARTVRAGTAPVIQNGGVATAAPPAIRAAETAKPDARLPGSGLLPVVVALAACAALGVYAGPLATLLHAAARTIVTP